jgi:hypothetical protein
MRFEKEGKMRNFFEQFTSFTAPKGLYCVWVHDCDRAGEPLVARWIDPRVDEKMSPVHEELRVEEQAEAKALQLDPDLALACAAGAF